MTQQTLAGRLQYTNIAANATQQMIEHHCETAAKYQFNAVMIQPCWIEIAREILRGTGVRVATAIAFPLGGETTKMKVSLAREVIAFGADEFDFQPNIGFLRSRMLREFTDEIRLIVEAAEGRPTKSMSEFGFLSEEERILCITLAEEAGVAYIKNSSGVGPGGSPATPDEISFIRRHIKGRARIKASGGIKSYEQVEALVKAGADLIGSSAAVEIINGVTAGTAAY